MNICFLVGNLTRDPDIRSADGGLTIAKYTLAVRRPRGGKDTDFIPCVAFGKTAEFAEKYLKKGTKICVSGYIQTGSYKDKEGRTVFTTDVIVDSQEFLESKGEAPKGETKATSKEDGFMQIPNGVPEELPFD